MLSGVYAGVIFQFFPKKEKKKMKKAYESITLKEAFTVVFSFLRPFFPKQFTVGVLDSILSMSALFGCHDRP